MPTLACAGAARRLVLPFHFCLPTFAALSLLGGCAVYAPPPLAMPAPLALVDGTYVQPAYSAPPVFVQPGPLVVPGYVAPPIGVDLWLGYGRYHGHGFGPRHHGWRGSPHWGGDWGGGHRGGGFRHR